MTTSTTADVFLAITTDLSRELPPQQRLQNLLQGLRQVFPCDATALLQLRGSVLVPLAIDGLSTDTLGRRFEVEAQPRLAKILLSREPVRFHADSPLPDPYDGLVQERPGELHVHDCLGLSLYVDDAPWGVLTLDAMQPGAFDRIDPQDLRAFARLTEATVKIANLISRLQDRAERHQQMAQAVVADLGQQELIGQSAAMQRLRGEIDMVAQSDLAVLITGETGVGKELIARRLHASSARSESPLVYVNCAALPDNLVESELFGHVRGAFSGAAQKRAGKFELANGGTLFLDEIGELPLALQPKLLRALQSGEIQRVGSDAQHQVDVRIIAATNRDLHKEVAAGHFRADLYHRLSVYPIEAPSLRTRGKDVLLLAGHFLEQNRRRMGLRGLRLSADAREALLSYDWPGNVRELEHLISRAVLRARLTQDDSRKLLTISADMLDISTAPSAPMITSADPEQPGTAGLNLRQATEQFQRSRIEAALAQHQNNQAQAAQALGLDRGNFTRLRKRLGV